MITSIYNFLNHYRISNSIKFKQLSPLSLLDAKEELIREGLKINIYLDNVDKLNLLPAHFNNSLHYAESVINRSRNFIKQLELRLNSNETNQKSVPHNVTIRKRIYKVWKEFLFKMQTWSILLWILERKKWKT